MNKLIISLAFILLMKMEAGAQSPVIALGSGLTKEVKCRCSDSLGNLYAVTGSSGSGDTLKVNKWDVTTKTWSLYSKMPSSIKMDNARTCNFFKGKFYLAGHNYIFGHDQGLFYELSGGTWAFKGRIAYAPTMQYTGYQLASVVYKNRLIFSGNFDSIGGKAIPYIAAFDGSAFYSVGKPAGIFGVSTPVFAFEKDSLFLLNANTVYLFNDTSKWKYYYSLKTYSYLSSIAANNHLLYAVAQNEIEIVKNGIRIDSLSLPFAGKYALMSFKDRVYLSNARSATNSGLYQIGKRKDLSLVFKNENPDTSEYPLYADKNYLYYSGSRGVKVKGTSYGYIVRLSDTFNTTGFDTINGYVFWDKNINYRKDGTDAWPKSGTIKNVTNNNFIQLENNTGSFEEIVLEDKDVEYAVYSTQFDSCLKVSFNGNLKSSNTKTGVTKDTLYFPMVRPGNTNINLVLRNQSSIRVRLLDTVPLTINVRNKDCYNTNTSNGTVKVTLDAGTVFLSSVPGYTSKNGNVYTYSGLAFNYSTDNLLKLKVIYPNTAYSLGQRVRHYAKLGYIAGEDSTDNLDSIVQDLVYSYDPNSKHSLPEGKITKDMKSIRYYIDFQNLGNDDAVRVTVVDTLNLKMPVYEFQMVAASHPYSASIQPGTSVVTWVFDNINLKPKSKNEAGSKGYIIFDAKVKGNLKSGDSIRNRAYIYFDYNSPVITNFSVINRIDPNSSLEVISDIQNRYLKVYPNPAQNFIKIENSLSTKQNIRIIDIKGVKVYSFQLNGNSKEMVNTENWAKGLYLVINESGESLKVMIE